MQKKVDSAKSFFNHLFKEATQEEIHDIEIREGRLSRLSKRDLIHYYQQYCFWNMLDETHLFSFENVSHLHFMGFTVKQVQEGEIYLTKILFKKMSDVNITATDLIGFKSSLHAFVEYFVIRTVYDTDQIPLDLFYSHYASFCNIFHIENINFQINQLKTEFGLETTQRRDKIIERDVRDEQRVEKAKYIFFKEKYKLYKIDPLHVSKHILMISRFVCSKDASKKYIRKLINMIVYERNWITVDIFLAFIIVLNISFFNLFLVI